MLRESLDAFNSLISVDDLEAHAIKLWAPLRAEFNAAAAAGIVDVTGGDSFPTFLLRHANRTLLAIALDDELAPQLRDIENNTNNRLLSRSSAAHRRWSASRSVFIFVFGSQTVTCRNAIDALNTLRLQRSDLGLVDLSQALDRVPIYKGTTRSGNIERSDINRFREALESLCPNAWPKTKSRKRESTSAEPDALSRQPSEDAALVPATRRSAKRARLHAPLEPTPGTHVERHSARALSPDLESDLDFQSESRLGSPALPQGRSHDHKRLPSEKNIEPLHELVQHLPGHGDIPDAVQLHARSPSPVSSLFSRNSPPQDPSPTRRSCDSPLPTGPTPLGTETSSRQHRLLLDGCADEDLADMSNVTEPRETGTGLHLSTIVEEEADSSFHPPTAQDIQPRSSPIAGNNPGGTDGTPFSLHPNVTSTRGRRHVLSEQDTQSRERNLIEATGPPEPPDTDESFVFTVKKSTGISVTNATPEEARSRRPSSDQSFLSSNGEIRPQSPQESGVVDLTTVATVNTIPTPPGTISSGQSIIVQSDSTTATNQADDSIDNEAWVSGAQLLAALTIIAESSSDLQPGVSNPDWLVIDSLATERRTRLNDATFAALSQAAGCLLPLHVSRNHWMLAVLRRDVSGDVEVDLYDSLKSASHAKEAKAQLDDFCSQNLGWSKTACSYVTTISCTQQANYHDCGVYTVAFAAHVVTRRAIPEEIDTRLWRFILDVMTKLETRPDPTVQQRLRALFESHYLSQKRLALPKCLVPYPEPPASGRHTIIEAQKHLALVQQWSIDVRLRTVERANELLPAWTWTCQQLRRTVLMLRTMGEAAKKALRATDDAVKVKLDSYNRYRLRLAHDGANGRAWDGPTDQRRDLDRERRRAETQRAYLEIWDFLIAVVEDGQRSDNVISFCINNTIFYALAFLISRYNIPRCLL
ncbi:hypothetical protein LZ30DRAFT_739078 [Colletotrichum cereale]|nr:hypothetical protein LZ30DRAFT_739078 [Colletotrichum cereale]